MAFSYGFFDSVNGDRKYTALEMSSIFDGIITDGVLPNYLNCFKVIPGKGLTLIVQSGRAWFDHTWNFNSSNLLLYVNDADRVLTRYDAVVLEVNKARDVRANTIKLITGMPSTSPTRPQLANTKEVKQYALAYIQVEPKLTAVTSNLIQNMVGTPNTPYATSKLTATDMSAVFQQWQGEFEEWYETVKHITSGENIAALQAELAKKLPKSEKATTSTPISDNTKYLTPATGLALVDSQVNPIGTIISTESSSKPSGTWISCNNSNKLQTASYPLLFEDMGHSYGMSSKMMTSVQYKHEISWVPTGEETRKAVVTSSPDNNSSVMSLQRDSEDIIPAAFDPTELVEGYNLSRASSSYYPAFRRMVVAPKPRATGSTIPFFAQGDVAISNKEKEGQLFDWSGTLTDSGFSVNKYDITENMNSAPLTKVWLQDSLVNAYALPDYNGYSSSARKFYTIAVVDDTNKYTVSVEVNTQTNVGTIYVNVYSGGASSLVLDSNRSYTITVPAPYGGCWVFNNQIYYISNNTIYIVTFGSASPIVYTGDTTQQNIIRDMCSSVYKIHYPDANDAGGYYLPVLRAGYSLDNRVYVRFYAKNGYTDLVNPFYVDIVLLKNEYTGEIERHRKRISFRPFQTMSLGSTGQQYFNFRDLKLVIKRNANGTITVAFIFLMEYSPAVYVSSWASGYAETRNEIYVGSVTGDLIKNDSYNIIYCDNPYVAPKISNGRYDRPYISFSNENNRIIGDICETLSNYAVSMYFSVQYTDAYAPPKWLQLVALMLDTRTFAMPWLNNVTNTNVFYIRIN